MASRSVIARGLALLHESFPTRAITEETGAAWVAIFAEVPDGDFLRACLLLCREAGRTFFPTSGEVMAYASPAPPQPDAMGALRQIAALSTYDPATGNHPPRVELVREKLGDAFAFAYGQAMASRLFSGSPMTREIAERDFAEALHEELHAQARRPQLSPA